MKGIKMTGAYPRWRVVQWPPNDTYGFWAENWLYWEAENPDADNTLWMDCSDDCRAAGYEVDYETDVYDLEDLRDEEYPTRLRDACDMPEWVARAYIAARCRVGVARILEG